MSATAALALLVATATPTPHPGAGAAADSAGSTTPVGLVDSTTITGWLLLAGAMWVVVYWISLKLHPNTKCHVCNGTAKHVGAFYKSASRPCSACGGKGIEPRLGRRIFFRGAD